MPLVFSSRRASAGSSSSRSINRFLTSTFSEIHAIPAEDMYELRRGR
jgi:hypothetical protein